MKKIVLRSEIKDNERRTPLTPFDVEAFIKKGHKIFVESCPNRIFKDEDYEKFGCKIVETGFWKSAPKDHIILGIKELPDDDTPLIHDHIYFAHAYKNQEGSEKLLSRFKNDGGKIYDIEFLTDESSKRVAAFGKWAGFVGAGLSLLAYFERLQSKSLKKIHSYDNKEQFIAEIRNKLANIKKPEVIIIGAKGRCGSGADELLNLAGISDATLWDYEETKGGGPFPHILDHDIFINTVLLFQKIPPFITKEILNKKMNLKIISDVSCDPNSEVNPIPIYNSLGDWKNPIVKSNFIDIIAVDNLPSVLPRESSVEFSQLLSPHILKFLDTEEYLPFKNSLESFHEALNLIYKHNI